MGNKKVNPWSELPSEIMERTLSFLPVPALCRCRTVCKRWNLLICKPKFGALCLQNAKQDACYLVARYTSIEPGEEEFGENHGWSFLDVNANRWYTIKKDQQVVFDHFIGGPRMAADGGLVCQIWEAKCIDDMRNVKSILVSNPVSKTSRLLPSFPYFCLPGYAEVNMVVDNVALTYKVFVMLNHDNEFYDDDDTPLLVVYDSKTNQWQRTTNPPMPQITELLICAHCSVFHDGLLYILTSPNYADHDGTGQYWIWSYNHVEETWNDTGVVIVGKRYSVQLLVSDKRLFLGSWLRDFSIPAGKALNRQRLERWSYEIGECNVEEKTYNTVFQRSRDAMVQVFDMPGETLEQPMPGMSLNRDFPFGMTASGFGKTIVLTPESSMYIESGVSMVFDPSTGLWKQLLPINPLIPLPKRHWLTFGNPMSLTLPASTSWIEDAA